MSSLVLYNGRLLPEAELALPLPNRGLQFNDGFFETLVWAEGRLRYLQGHGQRLQRAAAALGLELPPALATTGQLAATLGLLATAAAPALQVPALRLRLQLWRAGGGLYAPPGTGCEWLATAQPFAAHDADIGRAGFAETVQTHFSPVSFCKGPQALTYVLAARERAQRRLDELLLLDGHGHVAEGVAAAVFWLQDGELFTPALTTGCVAGVRRQHLLAVAGRAGLRAHEVQHQPAQLATAEAVFTANVAGIRMVRELAGRRLPAPPPLLRQLRDWEQQAERERARGPQA